MKVISFTKVNLPWGWLGNMSPHPIKHQDDWRTAEALFQAMRFVDPKIREEIRNQTSPIGAKLVAKKHRQKMTVEPRSNEDVANMSIVLKLKLEQHPGLKELLLSSGDAIIIEDCTNRPSQSGMFWGAAKQGRKWIGENTLGKLWMELRK